MLSDGTFEFGLRREIEVAGCDDPVSTLTFHECGEGYDGFYMKLRKFVLTGMIEAPKLLQRLEEFKSDDGLASGEEVKPLHQTSDEDHQTESEGFAEILKLALGMSDDLEKMAQVFGLMISNNKSAPICTADGVRMKQAAWERMHVEDKIDAAVKYCSFFGIGLDLLSSKEPGSVSGSHTAAKVL